MAKKVREDELVDAVSLPNEQIEIVVLPKDRFAVREAAGMTEKSFIAGTTRAYTLLPKERGSGFVNPFLLEHIEPSRAAALQAKLEDMLGLEEGALRTDFVSAKDISNSLWAKPEFKLRFVKQNQDLSSATIKLNLAEPMDYILYLVAKAHSKKESEPLIAPSWGERFDRASYLYAIKRENVDTKIEVESILRKNKIVNKITEAFVSNDAPLLYTIYNYIAYNTEGFKHVRRVDSSTGADVLFRLINDLLERQSHVTMLHDVVNMGDGDLRSWTLLFKAIEKGMLQRRGNSFSTPNGTHVASSIAEAIIWLNKDDQQGFRMSLTSKN